MPPAMQEETHSAPRGSSAGRISSTIIPMDGYMTDDTGPQIKRGLDDGPLRWEMVERNYAIACKCDAYEVLRRKLRGLIKGSIACWL